MAEGKEVRWADLSRFGAALLVAPDSPLRGTAMVCLEISDGKLFQTTFDPEGTLSTGAGSVRDGWDLALKDLGFGLRAERDITPEGAVTLRFWSPRTQFTLRELRRLVPGITVDDIKPLPAETIRLDVRPQVLEGWESFVAMVLAREAVDVWTPKANPFSVPYQDASHIVSVMRSTTGQPHPLLQQSHVPKYYGMAERLDRAQYRSNSLVPYYADLQYALEDGWSRDDLAQVTLPYALPLWVTGGGQIVALRDLRFAPELLEHEPAKYFVPYDNGLIVGAMRGARQIRSELESEVLPQWHGWIKNPETLEVPDLLWGSLTQAVALLEEQRLQFRRLPIMVRDLADGEAESRNGSVRAKALAAWELMDIRRLVNAVSTYVPLADGDREELIGGLQKTLVRGHVLLGDVAVIKAQQELAQVTQELREQAPERESQAVQKHVDAGEKIGGARKDYARRALVFDDVESMTELERRTLVVKTNIWPPLDYAALRQDGVTAEAAMALKVLKDTLATGPDLSWGGSEEEHIATYINAIGVVRDTVSGAKTLDEVNARAAKLFGLGQRTDDGSTIYGTPIQVQWGTKASNLVFDWMDGRTPNAVSKAIRKHITRPSYYGREIERSDDEKWQYLTPPKKVKTDQESDADKAKAALDRELHRPHLAKVERFGDDWRAGRDVGADDLMQKFGFRAVEFGEWLPQDERQTVLNFAFDSFCDLAQALNIPPQGIALRHQLAIAFGSRGHGGRKAALAHFEPARNVINLTRLNGAGSLAHEWGHALDWHLGKGKAFASISTTAGALGVLVKRLESRNLSTHEISLQRHACARRSFENAASWLYRQPEDSQPALKKLLSQQWDKALATFQAQASLLVASLLAGKPVSVGAWGISLSSLGEMVDGMTDAIKSACPDSSTWRGVAKNFRGCADHGMQHLAIAVTADAFATASLAPQDFLRHHQTKTDFVLAGEKLDKGRSKPYWATTIELFARAFAADVSDRVAARDGRSDYLVYGAEADRHAGQEYGNPNPTGDDRFELSKCFDDLLATYRAECLNDLEAKRDSAVQEEMAGP